MVCNSLKLCANIHKLPTAYHYFLRLALFPNEGVCAMIGAHFQDSSKPYKSDHKI
jgi:hypothetical protein